MSDRDVNGMFAVRWNPGIPLCLSVNPNRVGSRLLLLRRINAPGERMLGDADGRDVESHACVARDPEEGGMESAMSIDHDRLGRYREPPHRGFDAGHLPERQVARDLRKSNLRPDRSDGDGPEGFDVERCRGRIALSRPTAAATNLTERVAPERGTPRSRRQQ